MAITILGNPTTPNVTDTKLVYSISSSNAIQPQFQYVTDVYQGSNLLTRLYTYPNPTGNGIIEVSQILADNLEYDNDWKTTGGTISDEGFKEFTLHFSESYGSSISSSTTVYAGGASHTLEAFQGTVDPNEGSFNFQNSGSFQLLTNQVEGYVAKGNHVTVPVYVPPFSVVGTKSIRVEFVSASGDIIYANNALSTGANYEIYQQAIGSGSSTFGTYFENSDWEYINVYDSGSADPFTVFNRVRPCSDGQVTFAFINHYGYYDYYSIGNPVRKVTDIERNTFAKPNVNYSSTISNYDITRRGEQQYNTQYSDRYEVTTDYLNKATADWVTELFDSPEVYVQESGNFIPVVITNNTYNWNMNESRQKLFQFTIQYRYANKRYDR